MNLVSEFQVVSFKKTQMGEMMKQVPDGTNSIEQNKEGKRHEEDEKC